MSPEPCPTQEPDWDIKTDVWTNICVLYNEYVERNFYWSCHSFQVISTTLIRDQNGLGFGITGGRGSSPFKEGSDVSFNIGNPFNNLYRRILMMYFEQLLLRQFTYLK